MAYELVVPIGRPDTGAARPSRESAGEPLLPLLDAAPPPAGAAAPSAVERCTRRLRDAIVSGELPPGLRLPPERALAERFGVNRVTVRSALARLEAEHLVSVRQGSGYAVRDYRRAGGPDLIATLASLAKSSSDRARIVADLLLVRRTLAVATLERLIEQADEASLRDVEVAVDRFEAVARRASARASGASVAELAAADLEVVRALVTASGSAVLELCLNPVASLLLELPHLQEAMYREPESNVAAFRLVLELVRKRSRGGVEVVVHALEARDRETVLSVSGMSRASRAPRRKR